MAMRSRTPRPDPSAPTTPGRARIASDRPPTRTALPGSPENRYDVPQIRCSSGEVVADMKHASWLIGISCAVGIVSADSKVFSQPANQVAQHPESQWSTVQTYCFGCHNKFVAAGNLFLDQLGAESVPEHTEIFEKVVRKLRGRQMPPPGITQPSQQEVDALIGWLESTLDESSKGHLAGHVAVQRLNRTEYANAVKDLLAVEIDPNQYLPADIAV